MKGYFEQTSTGLMAEINVLSITRPNDQFRLSAITLRCRLRAKPRQNALVQSLPEYFKAASKCQIIDFVKKLPAFTSIAEGNKISMPDIELNFACIVPGRSPAG